MPPKNKKFKGVNHFSSEEKSDGSPVKKISAPTTTKSTTNTSQPNADNGERTFTNLEMNLIVQVLSSVGQQAIAGGVVAKVNWADVANKTGITTSGAAAKRAERILRKFGIKMSEVTGSKGGRPFHPKPSAAASAPPATITYPPGYILPVVAHTSPAALQYATGQKRKKPEEDDKAPSGKGDTKVKVETKPGVAARKPLPTSPRMPIPDDAPRPKHKSETLADVLAHAARMSKKEGYDYDCDVESSEDA